MTQQIDPLLNIQKRFFYCHLHAKPPYPTLPGVYIYSLGVTRVPRREATRTHTCAKIQ